MPMCIVFMIWTITEIKSLFHEVFLIAKPVVGLCAIFHLMGVVYKRTLFIFRFGFQFGVGCLFIVFISQFALNYFRARLFGKHGNDILLNRGSGSVKFSLVCDDFI